MTRPLLTRVFTSASPPLGAARVVFAGLVLATLPGCTMISHLGTDERGRHLGRTYFVGGAGSVGNVVGTFDVSRGLRKAGYRGSVEVFAWQAVLGGTVRDQIDRSRNESQGRNLAARIQGYTLRYPGRPVNIVALSAGTGVATWALEALPKNCRVRNVVFLASSLSRDYDLTAALRRIDGRLHCFYSDKDPLLRYGLPITGSIDRESTNFGAAGLAGFIVPRHASEAARALYTEKLRNHPYKEEYAKYGYHGWHADSTSYEFIAAVIAPLLEGRNAALGTPPDQPRASRGVGPSQASASRP
ncbi:MAG: hypothetical protein AB1716_04265 [Planctomycetota bacterium]